jgi:heme-degrading monooxygenase HmoA
MAITIVKTNVPTFEAWKKGWEDGREHRRAGGAKVALVARDPTDPKSLTVVIQWSSAEAAQKFLDARKAAITANAGGTPPEMKLFEQVLVEQY